MIIIQMTMDLFHSHFYFKEFYMIQEKDLKFIEEAISVYNELVNKRYLIAFAVNKDHPLNFTEIKFESKNFWHLIGFHCSESISEDIYNKCQNINLNKNDILKSLSYVHGEKYLYSKLNTIKSVLDFTKDTKYIFISNPLDYDTSIKYQMVMGNKEGFVGYNPAKEEKDVYIAKTSQNISVYKINKDANQRFIIILSKNINSKEFSNLEYEIKKGVFKQRINEFISNKIPLSKELLVETSEVYKNKDKIENKDIFSGVVQDIEETEDGIIFELEKEEDYLGK